MSTLDRSIDLSLVEHIDSEDARAVIETRFEPQQIPAFTLVAQHNQPIERIGFILSGGVCVLSAAKPSWASPFPIEKDKGMKGILGPGDFFGLESLFDKGTSLFDQMTVEPVKALCIKKRDIADIVFQNQSIRQSFEYLLIKHLKNLCGQLVAAMSEGAVCRQSNRPLDKTISFIDSHYMSKICLDDVAEMTGMSRFHFCRLFRQKTGRTFKEYLNFKRLEAAKRLLKIPEINISQACYAVGFNDASYFARLFKKYEGISPTAFRKTVAER